MHGRDVDLGLFAQIEIVRQSIERDLHPALFVDAVALRLDPGNPPLKPLVREGAQHDLGRLPDLNFTRFALIDVGEHPDRFRIDQGENRLSCAKRGTKLLLARGHHGIVGRREGVKIQCCGFLLLLCFGIADRSLRHQNLGVCQIHIGKRGILNCLARSALSQSMQCCSGPAFVDAR